MYKLSLSTLLFFGGFRLLIFPQTYTDIINLSFQTNPDYFNKQDSFVARTIENFYIKLPVSINKSTYIISGGSFEKQTFNYSSSIFNFYSPSIYFGFQKQWNEKHKLLFLTMPKLFADQIHFSLADVQFRAYGLWKIKKSESLTYNLGIYFNNEYYGLNITPLVGVDWKVSDELNLSCTLPQKLNIEYKIKPYLFIGHQIQNQKRSIKTYYFGSKYYLREGNDILGSTSLSVYAYLFYKIIAFTVETGYVLNDYFTLYDNNSNKIEHYHFSKNPKNFMLQLKLNYRT
jgi:hypothetical protein